MESNPGNGDKLRFLRVKEWLGQQLVLSEACPAGDKHLLYFQSLVAQSLLQCYGGKHQGRGRRSALTSQISEMGRLDSVSRGPYGTWSEISEVW